jgi:hypothetical protein
MEEKRLGSHDHPAGAIAALDCTRLNKRFLDWIQFAVFSEPLNRGYLPALCAQGKDHARVNGTIVQQDGAATAAPRIAPSLGAYQPQLFPQHVQQSVVRLNKDFLELFVNRKGDLLLHSMSSVSGF